MTSGDGAKSDQELLDSLGHYIRYLVKRELCRWYYAHRWWMSRSSLVMIPLGVVLSVLEDLPDVSFPGFRAGEVQTAILMLRSHGVLREDVEAWMSKQE